MSFDLLNIGKQATLGHQRALQITGNNIANVNTPGYVRERPVYTESGIGHGLDRMQVERMIDQFTQRQVRIDTSRVAFTSAYIDQASRIDTVLGNDTGSPISAIEDFFDLMHDANNDPGSLTYRELMLTEGEAVTASMRDMAGFLENQYEQFNERLELETQRVNTLVESIAQINKEISSNSSDKKVQQGALNTLMNERDEKLNELAEYVDIKVLDFSNGRQSVNLAGGQSLIMEDGNFNLITLRGNPNPNRLEMTTRTQSGGKTVDIPIEVTNLGGKIGGLIAYRDEVLEPTQFKLGQLAMGFADAVNEQGRLGMDLDNQLGMDFFDLSDTEIQALPYARNNEGTNQTINVRLEAGKAAELTAHRYELIMLSDTQFKVVALDTNGQVVGDPDEYETGQIDAGGNWTGDLKIGMEFQFAGGTFEEGDKFEVNFTQNAAENLRMNITRPEEIAMAAPVRVAEGSENSGGGVLAFEGMQSVDNFFDRAPDGLKSEAPVQLEYHGFANGQHQLLIRDNNNEVIGYYQGARMDNVLSNAVPASLDGDGNPVPQAGLLYPDGPDYDVTVTGNPDPGDLFNIEYNTNGFADNNNGVAMSELQRNKTLRRNPNVEGEKNMMSFNEGYGRLVSDVGNKVAQGRTANEAADSLLEQSKGFYESVAGVSLDEEASNLLKYEQSYNAAARIITVSQTIFDTLLNSTR